MNSVRRTKVHNGGHVDWHEDDGVVRVVRLVLENGTATDFPSSPELGMCFGRMPRQLWDAVRRDYETERDARRGVPWTYLLGAR